MDDYLFYKSYLVFYFHSVLVLPYFCLDIALKVFRSKNKKTMRLNIEQVSFSKEFFKHVLKISQHFFPEHHFVVSTMTAWGFLNGWRRLTKQWECWQRSWISLTAWFSNRYSLPPPISKNLRVRKRQETKNLWNFRS